LLKIPLLKSWVRSLPKARLGQPKNISGWIKYVIWRVITPIHPYVRDLLTYSKVLRHEGRQNYLLGKLAPNQSIEDFVQYLLDKGFGNHFVAFTDEGQLVSLRYSPSFEHQYHIRVFHDGEVRGHYEYTPECRPFLHMKGVGMEPRIEYFMRLLGDRIVPTFSSKQGFAWSFLGSKR
jgi:hypothetical protein